MTAARATPSASGERSRCASSGPAATATAAATPATQGSEIAERAEDEVRYERGGQREHGGPPATNECESQDPSAQHERRERAGEAVVVDAPVESHECPDRIAGRAVIPVRLLVRAPSAQGPRWTRGRGFWSSSK